MAYNILNSTFNPIDQDQCIGDTLDTFNVNFSALDTSISRLSAAVGNIPTPTPYNDTNLYTLINTLSTDMKKLGNYPYLEYGWVTAPNTGPQVVTTDAVTTLTLNTEIVDIGNFGALGPATFQGLTLTNNRIGLAAGTYQYEIVVPVATPQYTNTSAIISLFNVTDVTYVSRTGCNFPGGSSPDTRLNGQFTITTPKIFELRILGNSTQSSTPSDTHIMWNQMYRTPGSTIANSSDTGTAVLDQRTTIKLWKVG